MYHENFQPRNIVDYHPSTAKVDLLMHGSPCQDFSRSGLKRGGERGSGTRSSLLYETIRIIQEMREKPKMILWENVKCVLDKNFRETAIRETIEELQIKRNTLTNISKFGILVAATGVIIECYLCKLNIKSLDEINYNKDEVERLLFVPIDFFIKNKAIKGEVEISNTAKFDVKEYNFPERYAKDWKIPSRYVYIYMYEDEPIWGITAEIIFDFIRTLKEDGKVGFYEYR